jgi:hypothetical protein
VPGPGVVPDSYLSTSIVELLVPRLVKMVLSFPAPPIGHPSGISETLNPGFPVSPVR